MSLIVRNISKKGAIKVGQIEDKISTFEIQDRRNILLLGTRSDPD